MRILVVDNYDSFTWNLWQLLYRLSGEPPRVVRNDACAVDELIAWGADAVVLSPGPGSPAVPSDVGICPALVAALPDTPILGVCLGHQILGASSGARIVPAPAPMHGRLSTIRHDGSALFAALPARLDVVRYHSLVLDAATLPPSFSITAETCAGDDKPLIMAIAHRERPHLGVQFHPESILTDCGERLVENFLDFAREHRPRDRLRAGTKSPIEPESSSLPPRASTVRELFRELPFRDPEAVFASLYRDCKYAFWLDGSGRFSYIGDGGSDVLRATSHRIERTRRGRKIECSDGDFFACLGRLLDESTAPSTRPFELSSGYVGYLGYELKELCEGGTGPRKSLDEGALPDAVLMRADRVLAFDRELRTLTLSCLLAAGDSDDIAMRWFDDMEAALATLERVPSAPIVDSTTCFGAPIEFVPTRGESRYKHDIARIHRHLLDGETYEICLTTRFEAARGGIDPLDLDRILRRQNPAPWSAFLKLPEACILSASPERFVHIDPAGAIESRPIKGTRRRGGSDEEDARIAAELAGSEKDRAENLMIVDLVRNDLGRVCVPGSVVVPRLMEVETHPSVLQLVSTVRGQLAPSVTRVEAVRALFPGGSMTGAPKIRAMRIIGELEESPRGVYSGGIGFFSSSGAVDLSMAIRTIVAQGDELSFGVGGAVVALSDADAEWDEALAKGQALVRAIRSARGEPDEGAKKV